MSHLELRRGVSDRRIWTVVLVLGLVLTVGMGLTSQLVDSADPAAAHGTEPHGHAGESHHDAGHGEEGGAGGHDLPRLWGLGLIPFAIILGCIAILPLMTALHHWWESNLNRLFLSLLCAAMTLYYVATISGQGGHGVAHVLEHAILAEYIPFIVLLFSLYVVSGGISLRGDLEARPIVNTAFLAAGALMASFIGTTGASMLLIRPLLQTNSERKRVVHTVVFFIMLVSNVGGALLPIGDPPLFLGYLKGVPFFWTFGLTIPWAVSCACLLVIYFCWDVVAYRNEALRDIRRGVTEKEPLRLRGSLNFLWLAGVVAAVAFLVPGKPMPLLGWLVFPFLRELVMLAFVGLSLLLTPRGVREYNSFNYAAILEVAAIFIGIFITMQVPVEVLRVKGASLGLTEPWQFFWATGLLSSILDNAPTYVVFFETASALATEGPGTLTLGTGGLISEGLLVGISLGAVFLGAMTYIGNGPNFMVKAIAEQSGIRMPSFFGYVLRYSLPVLIPVFLLVTYLFLIGPAGGEPALGVAAEGAH